MWFYQGAGNVINSASQISDVVWRSINGLFTSLVERSPFIIAGLLVALIFIIVARIVKSAFLATTSRARLDNRLRILFSRLIGVVIVVLGIFTALTVIIPSFTFGSLVTGVGFTTFIIGFATSNILNNLLSGVLILWQQPFKVGDQVFIDKIQGKVEYIGVRATQLRKDDGELVLIPNGDMYSKTLIIRGAGAKRRMSFTFTVGYGADVENAKKVVGDALRRTDNVTQDPSPNVCVTDLTSDGVILTVLFWVDTQEANARESFDRAAVSVVTALNSSGVEPYPPGSLILRGSGNADESPDNVPFS